MRKPAGTFLSAAFAVTALAVGLPLGCSRSSDSPDGVADLVPASDLKPVRPPAASPQPLPDGAVDLLDSIRVADDAIAGSWGFQDRALITSAVSWGRLQTPCLPPAEYDLRLRVVRKKGVDSLNIGYVFGGRQGMIVIDGNKGEHTWLAMAEGNDGYLDEASAVQRVLKLGQAAVVLIQVRASGIVLKVDDKTLIDWKGKPEEIAQNPAFRVPNPGALYLGSWETVFRIEEATLLPVSGKLAWTR